MRTLVLGAIMLSDSVFKLKSESRMLEGEKLDKEVMMQCFKELCVVLQNASKPLAKLKAIRKKYMEEKRMGVSKLRI